MSALSVIDPASLFSGDPAGMEVSHIPFDVCEVEAIRYKAGQVVPMHSHSGGTLKVVLQGALAIESADGEKAVVHAGEVYPCAEDFFYTARAEEDTLMLLLQAPGTHRVNA